MLETITGTKELTGLEMTRTKTLERSQHSAIESPSWLMIPAFTLNKSSRVMPGFLGTPAGMTTIEALCKQFSMPPAGEWLDTEMGVSI